MTMSVLSSTQKRRRRIPNKVKLKAMGSHNEFLSRIKKTLYYGKIPLTERFSLPVTELAAELYSNVKTGHTLERLCVDETAEISRNACVSPCSLILALFYLERLKTCNPDYIDRVSPSELFVVSMMVASKFLHDDGEEDEVFNSEWAKSAGIQVNEINRYEKDFLNAINWEVFVNEASFWIGLKGVEREVARREGRRRGWFSYTELLSLLDVIDAWSLAHTLVVVSVVCLTSYTASVLTLVGSAMIASQINVPVFVLSPHLQQLNVINNNIPPRDCFYSHISNLTSFEGQSLLNDESSLLPSLTLLLSIPPSTLSSLSWVESRKSTDDSNYSLYNEIDDLFRYKSKNDFIGEDRMEVDNFNKADGTISVMTIGTEENDSASMKNLLSDYFEKSSTSPTLDVNTMDLNDLFSVSMSAAVSSSSSSSSSSSAIRLPSFDVTL